MEKAQPNSSAHVCTPNSMVGVPVFLLFEVEEVEVIE